MSGRIGIDVRMIHSTGIGSYIQGLLSSWAHEPNVHPLTLFGNLGDLKRWPFPAEDFRAPVYSLQEQWAGSRTFSQARLDLLHVPHYNVPLAYQGRLVVTIHDVIHLLFPGFARRVGGRLYARLMLNAAVRKAKRIIAVSRKTKEDILKHFSIDPEKIRVIHPAVAMEFAPASPRILEATLSRYGLKAGFILFVGDVRPHKNVGGLLEAHRLLRKRWPGCPPMVIVGKRDRANGLLKNNPQSVRWLGPLPQRELVHLYSSAGVFAFPSFYEGFGLPPLEAMACGCPVIVSSSGALPESVGEAGFYVDPHNPGSIADGIVRVLQDQSLRKCLTEQGLARSRTYSWEKTARDTWKVYEEALA
jgi:glycosyltransferase involved in cell wall biosynthesis